MPTSTAAWGFRFGLSNPWRPCAASLIYVVRAATVSRRAACKTCKTLAKLTFANTCSPHATLNAENFRTGPFPFICNFALGTRSVSSEQSRNRKSDVCLRNQCSSTHQDRTQQNGGRGAGRGRGGIVRLPVLRIPGRSPGVRASACVLPACVCPCVRTLRLGCALSCAYPRRACVCMRASSCVRLPLRARSAKGLWRGVGERPLRGLYNGPASSSIGHHQFREEASTRSAR